MNYVFSNVFRMLCLSLHLVLFYVWMLEDDGGRNLPYRYYLGESYILVGLSSISGQC